MKTGATTLILASLVAMGGCGVGSLPETDADGLVVIRMAGGSGHLMGTPLDIAQREGYFAEEGIDFQWIPTSESGANSLPNLDQGQIDVVRMTNLVALINAVDVGAGIKVVTSAGYFAEGRCPFASLIARKGLFDDGRPVTPASLKGLRIDYNTVTWEAYVLDTFMRSGGLSLADIEQMWLPTAARHEALVRGRIDGTVTQEPWPTAWRKEGFSTVLTPNEIVPNLQFTVYAFGSRLLEEDREAGRGFVKGFLRGVRKFNEGKTPENLAVAAEHTGLDVELLQDVCWPSLREDGRLETETLLGYQQWALEQGHIERVVPIEEMWDPEFTDAAVAALGPGADHR